MWLYCDGTGNRDVNEVNRGDNMMGPILFPLCVYVCMCIVGCMCVCTCACTLVSVLLVF